MAGGVSRPDTGGAVIESGGRSVQELISAAERAISARRLDEAEAAAARALALDPRSQQAKLLLAKLANATGRPKRAETFLREVLGADPNCLEALLGLASLLAWNGDVDEAIGVCERAIRLNPNIGIAYYQLGLCRLRQGLFSDAAVNFEQALQDSAGVATIHHHLGLALQGSGRSQDAIGCFRKAIALDPNAALSYAELGHLLLGLSDFEGAVACFRRVAELQPKSAKGRLFLGRAFVEEGNLSEGEASLRQAISMDPELSEAYVLLARTLQQRGSFAEAETILDTVISRNPGQADGHYLRIMGRTITEEDRPMVDNALAILQSGSLRPAESRPLHYALGKAYDDLGEYEHAMAQFEEANRLSQERLNSLGRTFDGRKLKQHVDQTIAQFTAEYLAKCQGVGADSERPIFIVGMARSGTTLLEQMISCHSGVGAAGELGTWTSMSSGPFQSPDRVPAREEIDRIAEQLLRKLDRGAPSRRFTTVKTPQNYMILGQIHATFPNAHILHCKRNPVDTCLSIYMTSFMAGPDFAHDREAMVVAYREYLRVMEHWRRLLPSSRFMEVEYEDLVTDPEPILREIHRFLGLEWNDACLRHERNDHAISTPSLWQARQPVFRKSVARWKRYEPWLGSLRELLQP